MTAAAHVARAPSSEDAPRLDSGPPAPKIGAADTIVARGLEAYLRWVARRGRWAWVDGRARCLARPEIDERLSASARGSEAVVITYYIADALGIAALGLMHREFGDLLRSTRCLVDETFAGRVCGSLIGHLGGRIVLLPRANDPDRMRAVHAVMRSAESCAFPVDGGGPYREVGTGIIGLAASLKATIVPVAVRAIPAVVLAPQSRVRVPLPGSRIVGAIGAGIPVASARDRRTAASELKTVLDGLSALVRTPA